MESSLHGEYPDLLPEVGERMKRIRDSLGLSQSDVADEMGVSRSFVSSMENGKKRIALGYLVAFSKVYKTSVEWLLEGDSSLRPISTFRVPGREPAEVHDRGDAYGNVHGNVSNFVHKNVTIQKLQVEAAHCQEVLEGKEALIESLRSEIQALKEVAALWREKAQRSE